MSTSKRTNLPPSATALSDEPVLDALYKIDGFLRFDLANSLQHGGELEPQRDWSSVTDAINLVSRHRVNVSADEWDLLQRTFADLQSDLNDVLKVFRDISILKGTDSFDEPHLLARANAAIDRVRQRFQSGLSRYEDSVRTRNGMQANLDSTLVDRTIARLKNNRFVAFAIVFGIAVTAVTSLTDVIDKTLEIVERRLTGPLTTRPSRLPALPGDTGWIFAGYFRIDTETFVEGPYVSVQSTNIRGLRNFIEIGDTIGLRVARDVHIVDFKKRGTSLKLVSPVTKGVIDDNDKSGITLPAGTELLVRDVSEGRWPDNPTAALWLRVVYVPK